MNFKPNENFKYYMHFIEERMNIFWRRYNGESAPYTDDEILKNHKFTNVYRSLDRVSQFLIKEVIYKDRMQYLPQEDIFYRILIFKHFNSIETWKLLEEKFGRIDYDLSFNDISKFLLSYQKSVPDFKPYSNAYMLTAAFLAGKKGNYVHLKGNGWKKYQYYFYIFDKEIIENDFIYKLLDSKSLEELYNNFLDITSVASFLSMQYSIDMNYSPLFDFDENDFIIAGLGAKRGIDRTFDFKGKPNYEEVIRWVYNNFDELLEYYNCKFKPLPNRMPTLIDLQNCFCETSKYLKGVNPGSKGGEKRIKNKFKETKTKIEYNFPLKWNVKL